MRFVLPLAQQLVPLCLKDNLCLPSTPSTPHLLSPTHPLYAALVIFCATSEKDCEKPANPNSRYLYNCSIVAIALLYFLCKSYAAVTVMQTQESYKSYAISLVKSIRKYLKPSNISSAMILVMIAKVSVG